MADMIRVNTELLDRCANELKQAARGFDDAATILAGLNTGEEWWTKMGRFQALSLQDEGGSVQLGDAGAAVRSLTATMRRYNGRMTRLGDSTARAASMFDGIENTLKGKADGQNAGTGNGGAVGMAHTNTVVNRNGENLDGRSEAFDDRGGYGGDQGDLTYNRSGFQFLWWRLFKDQQYFDFVRGYPGFENYSDQQIVDLFAKLNQEGCGYVAFANSIFVQYEGRETDFIRDFGFPMRDDKGELHFNRLALDFYLTTDNKYYLDGPAAEDGSVALANDVMMSYEGREDEFRAKYGVELYSDSTKECWSEKGMQRVLDEYEGQSVVEFECDGTTYLSVNNRIQNYVQDKGLNISAETRFNASGETMSCSEIDGLIDEGKTISIGNGGFNLYNEQGQVVKSDVGGHWMTITGTTDDGRYIVSSWGKKYYLDPSELNGQVSYMVVHSNT